MSCLPPPSLLVLRPILKMLAGDSDTDVKYAALQVLVPEEFKK